MELLTPFCLLLFMSGDFLNDKVYQNKYEGPEARLGGSRVWTIVWFTPRVLRKDLLSLARAEDLVDLIHSVPPAEQVNARQGADCGDGVLLLFDEYRPTVV